MTTSGHLRIPNDLVEILARLRLNGTQWQILWAIWRQTLCWQKAGDWGSRSFPISIADLVVATNLNEYQVKRELAGLVEFNIVLREKSPNGKPAPGGRGHKPDTTFNLDTSTWEAPIKSSTLATLSGDMERVAETLPIGDGKGGETATLNETVKGGETATLPLVKGSGLAPQTVAEKLPITRKSATLSPSEPKLVKKHIKKHKETIYIKKEKKIFNGNVYLSDEQHQDLIKRFGEAGAKDKIEALSLYMLSKGKSYVNHYATILNWERMNAKKEKEKPIEGLRMERFDEHRS